MRTITIVDNDIVVQYQRESDIAQPQIIAYRGTPAYDFAFDVVKHSAPSPGTSTVGERVKWAMGTKIPTVGAL